MSNSSLADTLTRSISDLAKELIKLQRRVAYLEDIHDQGHADGCKCGSCPDKHPQVQS